ncbi:MAG TPA: phosphotransferase family protein [Myxococcota bacterium]|nr:phosphotransferase family protein [Myxococcota bacterium]
MGAAHDEMAARLAHWCAQQLGRAEGDVAVHGLRRLAGGSSRETWSFDLALAPRGEQVAETRPLVLRRDPPGRSGAGESDRGLEFRVVRAAFEAGVPVPRAHWACTDPDVLGTSFYVMDRVEGEALPRRLLREERYAGAREKMIPELARIAAAIHRVPLDSPALAALPGPPRGVSAALAEIERVSQAIRALAPEPHPALTLAERWLRARMPAQQRVVLVHGDFRIGNVLFDEGGVRAVLDWEISKRGDPVEDLGWLCTRAWRFGSDELPAGGLASREALLAAYRDAGGGEVDPAHLRFWEAMGSYKVALVFIQQSWVYLSGRVPSLELASLGRRTAEAEEELIRLMEESP